MKKLNNFMKRTGLKIKKYSPEILLAVGIIGGVTSAVMACVATTKLSDTLEESKNNIDELHKKAEENDKKESHDEEVKMEEKVEKDLAIAYFNAGVKVVKLYAPSVGVGVISIMSVLTAHDILKKRNIALASAYTAVHAGFKEYRKRVVDEYGKETDQKLKHGVKAAEFEKKTVDEETGEIKVEKDVVESVDVNATHSPYAKFFDEGCYEWTDDAEVNLCFLRRQQEYANDLLISRCFDGKGGYVFLNEVYDMLGIPRTKAGQYVGWYYDDENPIGDNKIDFGIYNTNRANVNFVNGYEPVILLDFNVDGLIMDYITTLSTH